MKTKSSNFEYIISGDFAKKLKLFTIKESYEQLLLSPDFDGFSQIKSIPGSPKDAEVTLSSKDNVIKLTFNRDKFNLSFKNPLKGPSLEFNKSWDEIKTFLDILEGKVSFLSGLAEVRFANAIYALTPEDLRSKIISSVFAPQVSKNLSGFNATFSYHREDDALVSDHYHEVINFVVGMPESIESESFLELLNKYDPYFLVRQTILDVHDEESLTRDDVNSFLHKCVIKNSEEAEWFLAVLGAKANGKVKK